MNQPSIGLLEPKNQYLVRGDELIQFRWETDYEPSVNETFEVVLWQTNLGETAFANGRGIANVVNSDGLPKNITSGEWGLEIFFPGNAFSPGHYKWGVLIVQIEPYQRKVYLGGQREISVGRQSNSSGSSGGGCVGASCGE